MNRGIKGVMMVILSSALFCLSVYQAASQTFNQMDFVIGPGMMMFAETVSSRRRCRRPTEPTCRRFGATRGPCQNADGPSSNDKIRPTAYPCRQASD